MFFDSYDTPVFRPPSEARSFILRVTRGCAHNKCTYCNMYRGVPFQILKDEEISRQIALAAHYGKNKVRRVFLADGDALVLPTAKLLKILQVLREQFPHLQLCCTQGYPAQERGGAAPAEESRPEAFVLWHGNRRRRYAEGCQQGC